MDYHYLFIHVYTTLKNMKLVVWKATFKLLDPAPEVKRGAVFTDVQLGCPCASVIVAQLGYTNSGDF